MHVYSRARAVKECSLETGYSHVVPVHVDAAALGLIGFLSEKRHPCCTWHALFLVLIFQTCAGSQICSSPTDRSGMCDA